jgi:hypothetical protein
MTELYPEKYSPSPIEGTGKVSKRLGVSLYAENSS